MLHNVMKKKIRQMLQAYFKVRTSEFVRDRINNSHKLRSLETLDGLCELDSKIVTKIRDHGFATAALSDFLSEKQLSTVKREARRAQKLLSEGVSQKEEQMGKKSFLKRYTDLNPYGPISDLLASEFIKGRFSEIARRYFRQNVRITNLDYWLNFPSPQQDRPKGSQLWHRDYEDRQLLKVFIYFNKITENNGPLSYVQNTHYFENAENLFPTIPPLGVVVPQDKIARSFSYDEIVTFKVPSMSVVFVDTSGLHKGGLCERGIRFSFTATYTSFAGISQRLFLNQNINVDSLEEYQKASLLN